MQHTSPSEGKLGMLCEIRIKGFQKPDLLVREPLVVLRSETNPANQELKTTLPQSSATTSTSRLSHSVGNDALVVRRGP